MTGVDAVVVNYRTADDLARFVVSWLAFKPEGRQSRLRIVNVSPRPIDTEVANQFVTSDDIEVLSFDDNIGYGRACNLGAQRRQGDGLEVIALFNADVRLTPGAVQHCVEALTGGDSWAVLGPRQVNDERQLVHAGIVGTGAAPFIRGWKDDDRGQYTEVDATVPTVSGSAYFIKRSVWEQLAACPIHHQVAGGAPGGACGAFLPTAHYYEETWCSYHARAHGWKCVYFGPVTIVHSWHKASPVDGGWAEQQMPVSQALFRKACDLHGAEHD